MSEFILLPNLPTEKIKTVVIGRHSEIIEKLNLLGIETIVLDENPDIDFSVRNHADMAVVHIGKNNVILDKRQVSAAKKLTSLGFNVKFTDEKITGEYPFDVRLNFAIIGDKLLCGKKSEQSELFELPFEKITVNQGYCRCSVCILNEKAIITDDESIFKKCRDIFDVLLIEKGDILLEDKPYGFIGGASVKADMNTVMFFGSLEYHRDKDKIKAFLKKHGMTYIELFDGLLTDIGSVTAVLQN